MPANDDTNAQGRRAGEYYFPVQTVSLAALTLTLFFLQGAAPQALVFDRVAIADGEVWRLVTGHWVHSDQLHIFWNIAALLILGVLFERYLKSQLALALVVGMVSVDIWLWWWSADLLIYCGLSGILNSLLIVGLVRFWYIHAHPLVALVIFVAVLKIVFETVTAESVFTTTDWPSAPGAHAAGFLGGLALIVCSSVFLRAEHSL